MNVLVIFFAVLCSQCCSGEWHTQLECSTYEKLYHSFDICFKMAGYDVTFPRTVPFSSGEFALYILKLIGLEQFGDACRGDDRVFEMLECVWEMIFVCIEQSSNIDLRKYIPTFDMIEDAIYHFCNHKEVLDTYCYRALTSEMKSCMYREARGVLASTLDVHELFIGIYLSLKTCITEVMGKCGTDVTKAGMEVYNIIIPWGCRELRQ